MELDPQCPADVKASKSEQENENDKSKTDETTLPKLSPQEFRQWNHMADEMNLYHNHFRATWNQLYNAASTGKRPQGMSIRAYLRTAEELCGHLTAHHTIEERYIFPLLARKMPAFQNQHELLTQHKRIHEGIDKVEDYVDKCKTGEKELRMEEFKEIMDSFGTVLWQHLDDEVAQLGAENMRKFWTLDEMRRMPM